MQYIPDIHLRSQILPQSDFSLIGDILTVHPLTLVLLSDIYILQMSRLQGSQSPMNMLNVAPASINCTGYVFEIDRSSDSFLVTTWQLIHGSIPLNPLTIRGIMSVYECKDMPYQNLPKIHTVLTFQGDLITITDCVAFVAVRNHSYFSTKTEIGDETEFRDVFDPR